MLRACPQPYLSAVLLHADCSDYIFPKSVCPTWSCSSLSARFVLVVVLSVASLLHVSVKEGDGLLAKALLFLTLSWFLWGVVGILLAETTFCRVILTTGKRVGGSVLTLCHCIWWEYFWKKSFWDFTKRLKMILTHLH